MKTELYVNNDIGLETSKLKQVLKLLGKYFPKVYEYKKPVNTFEEVIGFVEPTLRQVLKKNPQFRNIVIINLDKTIESADKPHKLIMHSRKVYYRNVDLSRTVDINGKYVEHHIGKLNSIPYLDNSLFIIYDSDLVRGYGVKLLAQKILKEFTNPDAHVHFECVTPFRVQKHQELLDLSDLTTKGVVLNNANGIRLPYLTNEFTLNKYVSIPEEHYMDFKKSYISILEYKEDAEVSELIAAMHKWSKANNRKSFVIGVSGGIDSAVCLALLCKMRDRYPTYGYTIVPVVAPITDSQGTTGQIEAAKLALDYLDMLGFSSKEIVYKNLSTISKAVTKEYCLVDAPQLQQQNDYWLRPQLFHSTAERYNNSCMVGTVNFSEWYLGWFSQYLDIFNLMPIVHLSKGAVVRLAQVLNVSDQIIKAPPSGGLANGATDEESFKFSYADLESYFEPASSKPGIFFTSNLLKSINSMHEQSKYKRDRFNRDYVFAISDLISKG